MANPWRGEVSLVIDGVPRTMRLSLGALATLEAELEADSLVALVERFETGAYRAGDVIALIHAGLNGASRKETPPLTRADVMQAEIAGGPMAAAQAAALMLTRAFAPPQED